MKGILKTSFWIVFCIVIIVFLAGVKFYQINKAQKQRESQPLPANTVASYIVKKSIWSNTIKAVGGLVATEGAMLSAESDARVEKILFQSGSVVKKGDVLVELDAKAEIAALDGAKARLELAKINLKRQQDLRASNANSKMDLDNAVAEHDNASAAVDQLEALIQRRTIVAPFDGVVGIRSINVGQMVRTGTDIVAVHALDPLYVNFYLPEKDLSKIKIGNKIEVSVDVFPDRTFPAILTAIDSYVDAKTRNVLVQGTLQNPDKILRAGVYARVVVDLGRDRVVYAIPSAAISYAPFGNSVFVINKAQDPNNPVRILTQKFVRIGARKGDMVEILGNGLQVGDEVVSSGTFMLNNGGRVIVNNKVQPSDSLSPKPANS